jgi:hypothetical protein
MGFRPTDFSRGLEETYRWYVRHRDRSPRDYRFEDELLNAAAAVQLAG